MKGPRAIEGLFLLDWVLTADSLRHYQVLVVQPTPATPTAIANRLNLKPCRIEDIPDSCLIEADVHFRIPGIKHSEAIAQRPQRHVGLSRVDQAERLLV